MQKEKIKIKRHVRSKYCVLRAEEKIYSSLFMRGGGEGRISDLDIHP
jgi:hypothetical protein